MTSAMMRLYTMPSWMWLTVLPRACPLHVPLRRTMLRTVRSMKLVCTRSQSTSSCLRNGSARSHSLTWNARVRTSVLPARPATTGCARPSAMSMMTTHAAHA
eukprot:TRINITY_DN15005_c0_g1::TRINITY_DN15005_c0_g1_i1::g.25779::m.25779 TRINITY_DN15005_c0_g1::TRINITY_DN15005_c0_g1_i1::g.25779  ORF type:complete len:102 (+),score=-13.94,TP53IP5/PF15331.1/0.063 TRINITY_DN15005_c0_g1_i1:261-566(+)